MSRLKDRSPNVLSRSGHLFFKPLFEIACDQDSVIRRNPKQRNKANPDRYAQIKGTDLKQVAQIELAQADVQKPVLSIQPQHKKPAGPRDKDTREDKKGRCDRMELQIQNKKNHKEGEWNNNS